MSKSETYKERRRLGVLRRRVAMLEKSKAEGILDDYKIHELSSLKWVLSLVEEYMTLEPLNKKQLKQFLKGCGSKRRYTERSAGIKAKLLLKEHKDVDVEVYLCGFCRHFHLGQSRTYKHKRN